MTDIKPRHYVTGIIISVLIVSLSITFLDRLNVVNPGSLGGEYQDYKDALDKSEEVQDDVNALETGLEENNIIDITKNIFTGINTLIFGGYNILISLFNSFTSFENMISGSTDMFGMLIPNYVPTILILLITSMLAFSIVSAIMQRDI